MSANPEAGSSLRRVLDRFGELDPDTKLLELETLGFTTLPGVRMNLAVYFSRQYLQTQEQHGDRVPQAVLDRHANNERFNTLLGGKQPYGWQQSGPDYDLMARNPRNLYD